MHLRAGGGGGDNERWFQIQDLIVEEIRKEMIVLGETMLQVRLSFVDLRSSFNRTPFHDVSGIDLGAETGELGTLVGRRLTTVYRTNSSILRAPLLALCREL